MQNLQLLKKISYLNIKGSFFHIKTSIEDEFIDKKIKVLLFIGNSLPFNA